MADVLGIFLGNTALYILCHSVHERHHELKPRRSVDGTSLLVHGDHRLYKPCPLNRVGYYYVALNFTLQFIVLIGVASFIALAMEVLRCGTADDVERIGDFHALQLQLAGFMKSYLLMKILVAFLTCNFFIWANSPLGKTDNLLAAQVYLTIVGVFFVAIPRQYVELRRFELWQRSDRPAEFVETRPRRVKAVAGFLDAFFIMAVLSVWKVDLPGVLATLEQWLARVM